MDFNFDFEEESEILDTNKKSENAIKEILDESNGSTIYGILGLGQGGGKIAQTFFDSGYKKCIALNTSNHDLELLSIPYKIKIGKTDGAGKDPKLSAKQFNEEKVTILEELKKVYGKTTEQIIIIASTGGGTGTGTILPAIDLCKTYLRQNLGIQNVDDRISVFTTIPTNTELSSEIVKKNSSTILKYLSDKADKKEIAQLFLIDNEKLKMLFPKATVNNFYSTLNRNIVGLYHYLNVLSKTPSNLVSFDKADYNAINRCGGHTIITYTSISEKFDNMVLQVKSSLNSSSFVSEFDIETATHVAIIIVGGKILFDNVQGLMNQITLTVDTISSFFPNKFAFFNGIIENEKSNKIEVIIQLSGIKAPSARYETINA